MKNVRKRSPRIKGICKAAEELGVTHQHLWAVLRGKRQSKSLMRKYRAMKRAGGGQHAECASTTRI